MNNQVANYVAESNEFPNGKIIQILNKRQYFIKWQISLVTTGRNSGKQVAKHHIFSKMAVNFIYVSSMILRK